MNNERRTVLAETVADGGEVGEVQLRARERAGVPGCTVGGGRARQVTADHTTGASDPGEGPVLGRIKWVRRVK